MGFPEISFAENIASEQRILLSCARMDNDPEPAGQRKDLLLGEIDWERLLRSARRHGLTPLLYRQVSGLAQGAVSEVVSEKLRRAHQENARRNLFLTGELLRIAGLLKAAGIPAIPLKGPVLAASLYGDLALREFSDLDILIPPREVSRAEGLLLSRGYRLPLGLTGAQRAASRWFENHHPLAHQESGCVIELHWDLMPRSFHVPFDQKGFWNRAESFSLGGTELRTLSAEDTLLFLCVHGSKHLWERLGWVCDVAQLVRVRQQIRWDLVIRSAKETGAKRMLFLGLFLANDLLGARLPERVFREVTHDGMVRTLAGDMKKRFFKGAVGPFGFVEQLPFYLRMMERPRDKIRNAFAHALILFMPTEEERKLLSLPDFLFPLHFLLRPLRLSIKYGGKLVARILWTKHGAEAGI